MASITYDGQSFLLDGRRVWLVSGSIHYARVPRALWAERIHQARQAGLNCVETTVVWSRHEPRHGQFDWSGENDVREFVRLIHQAGMYCILRPGPFVDSGYDLGGLPPWLLGVENVRLRTTNQPFLEACSRYITALAGQLRDLQVNAPTPKGSPAGTLPGPIVLLQNESGYTCGDDHLADTYLGELGRYWREAGFGVPIINANDLWQSVEGEIDGWSGYESMLSHLRQLGSIRPAQPRIVIDFKVGQACVHGEAAPARRSPGAVMRRLAEVLAAGGQFNISPFHGGTYFGFAAGRDAARGAAGFLCPSADGGAPVAETGEETALYPAVRRLCTFASRFSRVLSHLDPARQPVALLPEAAAGGKAGAPPASRVAVIHAVGSQGGVVFAFGDDEGRNSREPMHLLLPDGSTLPVDLGEQSAVWCLLETRLTGRANLDYCNLSALALVGRVFVCFGTPGARGLLSINGSPLETVVPDGATPFVHEHEGITVVVASQEQADRIFFDDGSVYLGVVGVGRDGKPILAEDARGYVHIDAEGKVTPHKAHEKGHPVGHAVHRRAPRVTLGEWSAAPMTAYAAGESPRYAAINAAKPHDLVSLGAPYGYGWYRLRFTSGSARRTRLMFPQAGHRLHLTLDGEPCGLVGVGPGAAPTVQVGLRKGQHTMVALAENAGRVSSGADLGEPTGLYGPAWEVEPIRTARPKLVPSDPVDVLGFRSPLWRLHRDDRTDAQRLTWVVPHRSKNPVIVDIGAFEEGLGLEREGGLLLLNGKPVHFFQQGGVRSFILSPDAMAKGNNELQVALVSPTELAAAALARAVAFYDASESPLAKAEWAFAKWEPPADAAFGRGAKHPAGEPCWWRAPFSVGEGDGPVLVDCAGLTKGQLYVNGRHVSRYWVATGAGKKVPPQLRYVVPRPLLREGQNELMIFDEHGATPGRVRVIGDASGGAFER